MNSIGFILVDALASIARRVQLPSLLAAAALVVAPLAAHAAPTFCAVSGLIELMSATMDPARTPSSTSTRF
jgi:hypothetical protein